MLLIVIPGDHAVIVTEAGWLETIDGIMKGA